jgi:hypothetical protein
LVFVASVGAPAFAELVGAQQWGSAHAASGPRIELDDLDLPAEAKPYEKFLRRTLRKEATNVDWGAGPGSTIQYRFAVQKLEFLVDEDIMTVRCAASGRLPRGRSAKSLLSFGGDARQQRKLVERVLTIVARGVLTRLSELERERRAAS